MTIIRKVSNYFLPVLFLVVTNSCKSKVNSIQENFDDCLFLQEDGGNIRLNYESSIIEEFQKSTYKYDFLIIKTINEYSGSKNEIIRSYISNDSLFIQKKSNTFFLNKIPRETLLQIEENQKTLYTFFCKGIHKNKKYRYVFKSSETFSYLSSMIPIKNIPNSYFNKIRGFVFFDSEIRKVESY